MRPCQHQDSALGVLLAPLEFVAGLVVPKHGVAVVQTAIFKSFADTLGRFILWQLCRKRTDHMCQSYKVRAQKPSRTSSATTTWMSMARDQLPSPP
jgi:hypothetical protein